MFTGTLHVEALLPADSASLKRKRSYIKPVIAALRKREVAAAEVGDANLHRRVEVGVAAISNSAGHVGEILDDCERMIAARPELEIIAASQRIYSHED